MAKPKAPLYRPDVFFAWRTPLLTLDELVTWADAAPLDGAPLNEAVLATKRTALRQRLQTLIDRPEIREALFLASPTLEGSLASWLEAPTTERGIKVERSLIRYFSRMSARSTPFGLFAGVSIGRLGASDTPFTLGPRDSYRRHTRLDGDYLTALTAAIAADRSVRGELLFRPSSSIYEAAGRLRYVERRLQGKARSYHLVAVEPSDYLAATLARARDGARLGTLAEALVDDDITRQEADEFIDSLVDSQILLPDLQPRVTGDEPVTELIEQLTASEATRSVAAVLDEVRVALATLDGEPLGASPERFRALAKTLEPLPAPVEVARLFQVDLVKPVAEAALGPALLDEMSRVVELLTQISPNDGGGGLLKRFADAFTERYEANEVPLLVALDEESGVGLGQSNRASPEDSPLLAGLGIGARALDEGTPLRERDIFLFGKALAAARSRAPWNLSDEDLTALKAERPTHMPSSFAVFAGLGKDAGGLRMHLHSASGPSAANLLGRFCHGDPRLTHLVRDHLRKEEAFDADAIFAEIVHLPEGRVGNVLLRPLLRDYEITYLGRSGAPLAQQIGADDLLVSIESGLVTLRSRRLGRRILPRLTTAHNFSSPLNLGLYRFLCALQHQGTASTGWSWGAVGGIADFLPRVTTGRTIVSLAQWRLSKKRIAALAALKGAKLFDRLRSLRAELELPRFIGLADADNILPIDLDNVLSVEMWVSLIKERPMVVLSELFPDPAHGDELAVLGPEGRFACEVVVPFLRVTPGPTVASAAPRVSSVTVERTLPPGSSALYAKIYSGEAAADTLLRDGIAPLVHELLPTGAFDQWFFLRYADPQPHLRIRFFNAGAPARLTAEVAPRLYALMADAHQMGLAHKLQLDTYEREIERYGGEVGMLHSERLFTADSNAALSIVELLSGDAGADARWRLTLRGMDQLLDDFGLDLVQKQALVAQLRKSYAEEFRLRVPHEKALGDRFRRLRASIEQILDRGRDGDGDLAPGIAVLAERSRQLAPIVADLRAAEQAGQLTVPITTLLGSYLHMWAIRLSRAQSRAHEAVIHDFLARSYESQIARAKKPPT